MSELEGQMSIFSLLEGYDAPRLPWQDCKQGVKAWTIQCRAVADSLNDNAQILYLEARPRRILFKRDSEQDQYGWSLFYDSVGGGNYFGGWGNRIDVFATQPTEADCERYARARYAKERRVTASTPYRPWTKED